MILRSSGSLTAKLSKAIQTRKLKRSICFHTKKEKDFFSLHITNVSEKDVGKYACKASVSDHPKANVDEDFIELSLYNKGEFHLLVLLLWKVP